MLLVHTVAVVILLGECQQSLVVAFVLQFEMCIRDRLELELFLYGESLGIYTVERRCLVTVWACLLYTSDDESLQGFLMAEILQNLHDSTYTR